MYSLYNLCVCGGGGGGGGGSYPGKKFGKSRMQEKPSTTFLGLFFIFLFFINQLSSFFSAILYNFQVILYILSPHYSLISFFFFLLTIL